jgi:hypothetical protein
VIGRRGGDAEGCGDGVIGWCGDGVIGWCGDGILG